MRNTRRDDGYSVSYLKKVSFWGMEIYHTLGRTVTLMEGSGLISGEKIVLYCVVTRIEMPTMRKIVSNDDYSAFMAISDVSEIIRKHIKSNSSKLK